MKKAERCFIQACLILVGACHFCFAKPHSASLDDRIDHFKVGNATWFQALGNQPDNGWENNLRMGLIFYEHPSEQAKVDKKFSLQLSSATVREMLDAITTSDTNYYWVSDGNVVNFIPRKRGILFDTVSVLNSTMSKCEATDVSLHEAISRVVEQARALGVEVFGAQPRPPHWEYEIAPEDRISFSITNTTLLRCLNTVVGVGPIGLWMAMPSKRGVWVDGLGGENNQIIRNSLPPDIKTAIEAATKERGANGPFVSSATIVKIAEERHYIPSRILVHLEFREKPGVWIFIVEQPDQEKDKGLGTSKCLIVDARAGIVLEENNLFSSNHNGPRCWRWPRPPRTVVNMHELAKLSSEEGLQAVSLDSKSLYWVVDGKWTEVIGRQTPDEPFKRLKDWVP